MRGTRSINTLSQGNSKIQNFSTLQQVIKRKSNCDLIFWKMQLIKELLKVH